MYIGGGGDFFKSYFKKKNFVGKMYWDEINIRFT